MEAAKFPLAFNSQPLIYLELGIINLQYGAEVLQLSGHMYLMREALVYRNTFGREMRSVGESNFLLVIRSCSFDALKNGYGVRSTEPVFCIEMIV
jgi:hypothetical protein